MLIVLQQRVLLVFKMADRCKHHILCDFIAVLLINGMYFECYVADLLP